MYLGVSLERRKDQLVTLRLRARPIQYRAKYIHLELQVGTPMRGTQRSLRALAFSAGLTTARPPIANGRQQVVRLTCSVLPFHRKSKIALVTLVWTNSGIGKTVAVYQTPEAPSVLIIIDLPFRESVCDFHMLSLFSSLVTWLSQLACVKSVTPKNTPRILSLSVTQVVFTGPKGWPAAEPIHKPSVFCALRREPVAFSKMLIVVNALVIEKSLVRIRVVSSAYRDTLLCCRGSRGLKFPRYSGHNG